MITPPIEVLMAAIIPRLKADAALAALVGERIYDGAPTDAPSPYVSLGDAWETQDDADGLPGMSIGFRINAWSQDVGAVQARRVAHCVRKVLHEAEIDLPEGALAQLNHKRSDTIPARDGLTTQVAIEFFAALET